LRPWERETKRQKSKKISALPWQDKAKEKQMKTRSDPGFAFCFIFDSFVKSLGMVKQKI